MRLFITGTGTGVGKTWITAALTEALVGRGRSVAALKPVETGCDPSPQDAVLLAELSGRPELAHAEGFHRGQAPLAPLAAQLEGELAAPGARALAAAIDRAAQEAEMVLAEGAGGPLVPLVGDEDFTDLASALGWPVLLVGLDGLGTLSHTLTAFEALTRRGVEVWGVVLTRQGSELSQRTNRRILAARLPVPVWSVGPWSGPRGNGEGIDGVVAALLARER